MKFLEKDVKKEFYRTGKQILEFDLGPIGRSVILDEKVLIHHYLRADLCVFTQKKSLISIEIKNKHDNLKRLPRQLRGYVKCSNYVYVLCHKKHLPGVIKIINQLHLEDTVGIIIYNEFANMIIMGLYKSAKRNPHFKIKMFLGIPWKDELMRILLANYSRNTYRPSRSGLTVNEYEHKERLLFKYPHPTKVMIMNKMLRLLNIYGSEDVVNNMFICNDQDPNKYERKHYFKEDEKHEPPQQAPLYTNRWHNDRTQ